MKKIYLKISLCFAIWLFLWLIPNQALANNLQITNVRLGEIDSSNSQAEIIFDVSWENSWRDNNNYDAAWIFAKYSTDGGNGWSHCKLKPTGHNVGDGDSLEIKVAGDNFTGFFIQPTTTPINNQVQTHGVKLIWDISNIDANIIKSEKLRIKVFGIEMVYIPQGSFYAGESATIDVLGYDYVWHSCRPPLVDTFPTGHFTKVKYAGGSGSCSFTWDYFYISNGEIKYGPYYSPSNVEVLDWNPALSGELSGWDNGSYYYSYPNFYLTINSNFPRGYDAFYIMKYEVSQKQYCDFLNTISSANSYYRGNNDPGVRYFIKKHPNIGFYGCDANDNNVFDETDDGQFVACGYISWDDAFAYLNWAGLRPMTELEFEKACRVANPSSRPTPNAYIWGYDYGLVLVSGIDNANCSNEVPSNNGNNANVVGGIGKPLRVGALAAKASSLSPSTTGASYYGVMELIGNMAELVISICRKSSDLSFDGSHGTGDVTLPNNSWSGAKSHSYVRGGSFINTQTEDGNEGCFRVSYRKDVGKDPGNNNNNNRDSYVGFRGVRTAPTQ